MSPGVNVSPVNQALEVTSKFPMLVTRAGLTLAPPITVRSDKSESDNGVFVPRQPPLSTFTCATWATGRIGVK